MTLWNGKKERKMCFVPFKMLHYTLTILIWHLSKVFGFWMLNLFPLYPATYATPGYIIKGVPSVKAQSYCSLWKLLHKNLESQHAPVPSAPLTTNGSPNFTQVCRINQSADEKMRYFIHRKARVNILNKLEWFKGPETFHNPSFSVTQFPLQSDSKNLFLSFFPAARCAFQYFRTFI